MQTMITTIGTSLLANYGWRRGGSLPDPATADAWLRSTDLKKASAETHTWLKLGILDEPDRHRRSQAYRSWSDLNRCPSQ